MFINQNPVPQYLKCELGELISLISHIKAMKYPVSHHFPFVDLFYLETYFIIITVHVFKVCMCVLLLLTIWYIQYYLLPNYGCAVSHF